MSVEVARVARGFDRLSPWYDLAAGVLSAGRLSRSQVAWLGRIEEPGRALVIGGGNGRFLLDLLQREAARNVVCLDISPGMLGASRRRLLRRAPHRESDVEFRLGGVESLGRNERFDLICTHCFLDLFEPNELRDVMRRLDAVLSDGGAWLASDFVEPSGNRLRDRAQRGILRLLYEFFGRTCGISPRRMPPIEGAFEELGYRMIDHRTFAAGLLWSGRLMRAGS